MNNKELEDKIIEMCREDRDKSEEDRTSADQAYNFFFQRLNDANDRDTSGASKETLAKLLEVKVAASERAIQSTRVLMDVLRERNRRVELDLKSGAVGQELSNVNMADLLK